MQTKLRCFHTENQSDRCLGPPASRAAAASDAGLAAQDYSITLQALFHEWVIQLHHKPPAAHNGDVMTAVGWEEVPGENWCRGTASSSTGALIHLHLRMFNVAVSWFLVWELTAATQTSSFIASSKDRNLTSISSSVVHLIWDDPTVKLGALRWTLLHLQALLQQSSESGLMVPS